MDIYNDIERKAFITAVEAHKDRRYISKDCDYPYMFHLYSVVQILKGEGVMDKNILCAAWLHDTIEDTDMTYKDVNALFGKEIAEIVYAVTDELGRNRKERKAKTLPKLIDFPEAQIVKLADVLANVLESISSKSSHIEMYRKEYPDLRAIVKDSENETIISLMNKLDLYLLKLP